MFVLSFWAQQKHTQNTSVFSQRVRATVFAKKKKRPCHTAGGVSYLTPSDMPAGVPTSSFSDPEKRCQQRGDATRQRGLMARASAQRNSKLNHKWARNGGPSWRAKQATPTPPSNAEPLKKSLLHEHGITVGIRVPFLQEEGSVSE